MEEFESSSCKLQAPMLSAGRFTRSTGNRIYPTHKCHPIKWQGLGITDWIQLCTDPNLPPQITPARLWEVENTHHHHKLEQIYCELRNLKYHRIPHLPGTIHSIVKHTTSKVIFLLSVPETHKGISFRTLLAELAERHVLPWEHQWVCQKWQNQNLLSFPLYGRNKYFLEYFDRICSLYLVPRILHSPLSVLGSVLVLVPSNKLPYVYVISDAISISPNSIITLSHLTDLKSIS